MRFDFIHAADLHVDSPFAALGLKDATVAARFAEASRRAVVALIDETIRTQAAFLLIAGDLFDGDWPDYATGLFVAREFSRLERAGIPVFLIRGNHDAQSVMSRSLRYPGNVTVFAADRAQTVTLPEFGVAIHGRSFPERAAPADFLASYPASLPGLLNIALLHTSLDGVRGHAPYVPCTVADLARFGHDYWALGHVHAAAIVSRSPWVVYPGNIQGRNPRETGAKGAVRISVDDGRIVAVEAFQVDVARWAGARVDLGGLADEEAALACIATELARVHRDAGGRPVALRLTLAGRTPLHRDLVARKDHWDAELRALGFRLAEDFWIEKLVNATTMPAADATPDALDLQDITALLQTVLGESERNADAAGMIAQVSAKLPAEMSGAFDASDEALRRELLAEAADHVLALLATDRQL